MKIRKSLVGIAAGSLALAGVAVVSAPAAQAYSGNSNLPGSLFLSNTPSATNATTNNTYNDTFSLTQAPASPNAGQTVTVTLSGATGALSGPVPVSANTFIVRGTVTLAGAQSGDVSLSSGATCTYPASAIGTNSAQGPWSITGTYVASGNGAASVSLKQIFFDDQGNLDGSVANVCAGSGSNADYYASAVTQTAGSGQPGLAKTAPAVSSVITQAFTTTGPNGTIVTSSGQNAGVQAVRMSAAYTSTVVLSGSVFGANAAVGQVTAQFCDVTGASCINPGYSDTNSLSVSGGALSGAIVHVPGTPGPTTGNRAIKVVNSVDNATALIPVLVLGTASVTLTPAAGGAGTVVAITGSNFNPLQAATAYGSSLTAPPFTATADPSASLGNASATGTISGNFTVQAATTASVVAYQGIPGAPAASNPAAGASFAYSSFQCTADTGNFNTGSCATSQSVLTSILAGNLSQAASAAPGNPDNTKVVLCKTAAPATPPSGSPSGSDPLGNCALTSQVTPSTMYGTLNPVTVTDARGGNYQWSLTAVANNLTDGTHTISKSALTISPSISSAVAGSAAGAAAGSASQSFSGSVTLCTGPGTIDATTGTTGGEWKVAGNVQLAVPAFQGAGNYNTTITITLA